MGLRGKKPVPDTERRARRQASSRKHRETNPNYRDSRLRYLYKITAEEYDQMLVQQGGVCAVCREPETGVDPRSGKVKALAVDHHHLSGIVRGLLCAGCNKAIGCFQDDPAIIRAAITYLEARCVQP